MNQDINMMNNTEDVSNNNLNHYTCMRCNTDFISSSVCVCPLCNSKNIQNSSINMNNFDGYIPFVCSSNDAINKYKKMIKFNPLIPVAFKKRSTIDCITKAFIPVNVNNLVINGTVDFLGADKTEKNQTISSMKKHQLQYDSNFVFNKVIINKYSKIEDNYLNSISDYTFNNLNPIDNSITTDSVIINSDISDSDCLEKLNKKCMNHSLIIIRDNINHSLKKLVENRMTITNTASANVLVPIYLLTVNYKNNNYVYIMNGETGTYNLKTTIGIIETLIFAIIVFVIVFLIVFLLTYFF